MEASPQCNPLRAVTSPTPLQLSCTRQFPLGTHKNRQASRDQGRSFLNSSVQVPFLHCGAFWDVYPTRNLSRKGMLFNPSLKWGPANEVISEVQWAWLSLSFPHPLVLFPHCFILFCANTSGIGRSSPAGKQHYQNMSNFFWKEKIMSYFWSKKGLKVFDIFKCLETFSHKNWASHGMLRKAVVQGFGESPDGQKQLGCLW